MDVKSKHAITIRSWTSKTLVTKITTFLKRRSDIGGAFLGGSHGRDEADAYSDIDVYVVVADTEIVQETLKQLADSVAEIRAPSCIRTYYRMLVRINCITEDWQRFDLTVVTGLELGFLAGGQVKPLFDDLGISDALVVRNTRNWTTDRGRIT